MGENCETSLLEGFHFSQNRRNEKNVGATFSPQSKTPGETKSTCRSIPYLSSFLLLLYTQQILYPTKFIKARSRNLLTMTSQQVEVESCKFSKQYDFEDRSQEDHHLDCYKYQACPSNWCERKSEFSYTVIQFKRLYIEKVI